MKSGYIHIRDYALYDLTMMKLLNRNAHQICKNGYLQKNNTFNYYFTCGKHFLSLEYVRELFDGFGLIEIRNKICTVKLKNRKDNNEMYRAFINCTFFKPLFFI